MAGHPGYWEDSYFAGGEGNLRTPCIVRRPGQVPGGRVSDEIMHVTDWFTTLLHAAGVAVPADRVIDGVNQLGWLGGSQATSLREGYIYWMGPEIYGVKLSGGTSSSPSWSRNTPQTRSASSLHPGSSTSSPTRKNANHWDLPSMHTWTVTQFNRLLGEFQASVKREPPIHSGAPLDFIPTQLP